MIKKNFSIQTIDVFGAREHNLKNINVTIPKYTLTVITGPSGSGKSSLALDILYTEGKRRYMESLSSYARQFLGIAKKPDVDRIDGLCPSIAIEQKTVGSNPRSTVGTITEIYDYLRVLFARIGKTHCPDCHSLVQAQSSECITDLLIKDFSGKTVMIAAPIVNQKKGEFFVALCKLFRQGYYRFLINGQQYRFKSEQEIELLKLKKTFRHSIDVLVDTIAIVSVERSRLNEAVELSFKLAEGNCKIIIGHEEHLFSSHAICLNCCISVPVLEPRCFSFNSPIGACKKCTGLGVYDERSQPMRYLNQETAVYAKEKTCSLCYGSRLNSSALAVTINDKNIAELSMLCVSDLLLFFQHLSLNELELAIAHVLLQEIQNRLQFLINVGLGYVSLSRSAHSLSGGEGQRIRLATQIGSALCGVLYVLDEPSIGLHQRDNDKLITTLKSLRDQGNTVVVVEHDTDTMMESDHIIDMGPASGRYGGQVTAAGSPQELMDNTLSLTGAYLSGRRSILVPEAVREPRGFMTLHNAKKNNLKNLTIAFPLNVMCGISGVSGSGKSTLIMQELIPAFYQRLFRQNDGELNNKNTYVTGCEDIYHVVLVDQTPIGRTPRSNPATYLGIFDGIRKLFASLPASNERGYTISRFSFNVEEGRCFECKGEGTITVNMQFLPEVTMECKACHGSRYNKETLQIMYKEKNIAQIQEMTAQEALLFFQSHGAIAKRLQLLCDVGLGYLKLGQPSTTLSGGEAQRIKLVHELAKRGLHTLYILDEPTTGLHSVDIEKLLQVFNRLVDKGNSMIIIEHNLDVLKSVDYLIDLGPEGGNEGGAIVAQGIPKDVACKNFGHTAFYLNKIFCKKL
jgi:excinuclease ABC subunit A